MRKQTKYTFERMNKDISKAKSSNTLYWDALNMRVITNDEFGSLTNAKGNIDKYTIPTLESNPSTKTINTGFPINNPEIFHTEKIDERVVIFTQKDTLTLIYLLDPLADNPVPELIYLDHLDIDPTTMVIESVGINENDESQKVYWVDGVNEIRFLNIVQDNINKPPSDISVTPRATLLDPNVNGYSNGGTHQSGVIQYAYNLYNKYGAETKISGLSELVALYSGDNGNALDELVNKSPNVEINDIPQNFEYIKVYSVYYSSLGQVPKISLIYESENTSDSLSITDTNDIIQEVSLNEFNIIGTQSIIPKHINNKDGHLFFADYKTKKFDVDYDARAFSFKRIIKRNDFGVFIGYDFLNAFFDETEDPFDVFSTTTNRDTPGGFLSFDDFVNTVPETYDCINNSPEAIYNINNEIGASGKNVTLTVSYKSKSLDEIDSSSLSTSLKRGEKYRIGVVFYNDKDEESFVKWITDIKIPGAGDDEYVSTVINNNAELAYLSVDFNNLPDEVKSYRLVKVKRLDKDKTVKAQGFLTNNILEYKSDFEDEGKGIVVDFFSNYLTRTLNNNELINPNLYQSTNVSGVSTLRGEKFQNVGEIRNVNEIFNEVLTQNDTFNYYKLSERDFSLRGSNSGDIPFSSLNDQIRIVAIAQPTSTLSKVDFYTSYSFNASLGNADKDSVGWGIEIEQPIEKRKTYTTNNTEDKIYLYQIDEENSSDVVTGGFGFDAWDFKDLFFNLENNEDDNKSFYLISPKRSTFTFTKEDTTTLEINDWEYKKILNNRKFIDNTPTELTNNIASFVENGYIIGVRNIESDTLVSNFSFFKDQTLEPELVNTPISFKNYTDVTNFKSNFYTISNNQIIFNSDDLFSKLEEITSTESSLVIAEIFSDNVIQYGGNTYEARQRNQYIPLSKKYTSGVALGEYGDTYIQKQSTLTSNYITSPDADLEGTLAEVITYVGESSINHDMRYDNIEDKNTTDNVSFENAFLYNDVYSQQSDLIKSLSKPFNFTLQNTFKSEVIASPKKQLGEFIDNWTKISINDRITMDTKYGAVTAFGKLKDNLFVFQRNAVAYLSINPRVQLSASDNIPIELGSGKLIERYEYISTTSGTLHPQSISTTESTLYYYDVLNGSVNKMTGATEEISLTKGLYNYFRDYTDKHYEEIVKNNVVRSFYDNEREEIYFTFSTEEDSFTVAYNLLTDGFTSFYSFVPDVYVLINNKMCTYVYDSFDTVATIWEHNSSEAEYSTYYGDRFESSITLLANEYPDNDKIFDTVSYVMDTSLNNGDTTFISFDSLRANTAYQDSGIVPLVVGQNLKRKFRVFRIQLPREENTRNRIRGPYALIKLTFENNEDNYKFVCYDMTIDYTLS